MALALMKMGHEPTIETWAFSNKKSDVSLSTRLPCQTIIYSDVVVMSLI